MTLTAVVSSTPSGAKYPPTLSFGSTSPLSITSTAAKTATLTISTTAATNAALVLPNRNAVPWYEAGGTALACLMLLGVPGRRRRWLTMLGMVLLLVTLRGGMIACGGGSAGGSGGGSAGGSGGGGTGSNGGGGTSNPGTTPGIYVVTVTGTSGTTIATGTVNLTVQ